ncbi:MAG: polyprenol monophosphomannose synthase [Thermoplasmata archaeon]|nr:MAG: polyprenol monophosphomannose synthase [Thermoplasmata archaeon]
MKVSIVLPTYNEKENIVPLIQEVLNHVKGEVEVIVVDDNSPDGTWKIVEEIADERVRLIRRMNERGLASAIRKGIESTNGDVVVIMDTDFSHPPETVPDLIAATLDFHIARGSRYVDGGRMESSKKRVLLSKMTNMFARLLLGFDIKDYTTNFFAARSEVFDDIKILDRWGMHGNYSIGLLYVAKKKGYEIKEVPFICRDRTAGTTKVSIDNDTLFRWGMRYCLTVLRLRFKNL